LFHIDDFSVYALKHQAIANINLASCYGILEPTTHRQEIKEKNRDREDL
jgi:hypothetical protein